VPASDDVGSAGGNVTVDDGAGAVSVGPVGVPCLEANQALIWRSGPVLHRRNRNCSSGPPRRVRTAGVGLHAPGDERARAISVGDAATAACVVQSLAVGGAGNQPDDQCTKDH